MRTKVVFFHWDRPGQSHYATCAARLSAQLDRLSVPYECHRLQLQAAETWASVGRYKPAFVLSRVLANAAPVLYIDADSQVLKVPDRVDGLAYDLAFVPSRDIFAGDLPARVEAGCIYANYTPAALDFLRHWHGVCRDPSRVGTDHRFLAEMLRDRVVPCNIGQLPQSYFRANLPLSDTVISYVKAPSELGRKAEEIRQIKDHYGKGTGQVLGCQG